MTSESKDDFVLDSVEEEFEEEGGGGGLEDLVWPPEMRGAAPFYGVDNSSNQCKHVQHDHRKLIRRQGR